MRELVKHGIHDLVDREKETFVIWVPQAQADFVALVDINACLVLGSSYYIGGGRTQ